jgi:hypothetical protein
MLKLTRLRAIAIACLAAFTVSGAFAIDSIVDEAEQVYRRYATDGVSASGTHYPNKAEIRALWSRLDAATGALGFDASGDGSTDVTTTLQAYVDAVPSGGRLLIPAPETCYKITDTILITTPMTVEGVRSKFCFTATGKPVFQATSSNVIFRGLHVACSSSSYSDSTDGFFVTGVRNAGTAPTYVYNVRFEDIEVETCGDAAIKVYYASVVSIERLRASSMGKSGVVLASVASCRMNDIQVDTLTGDGDSNAYGISMTRQTEDSGNRTSQPDTRDCQTTNAQVFNSPWTCYDTHSGQRLTFTNISCYNAKSFFEAGTSSNSSNVASYGPTHIVVNGFVGNAGTYAGSAKPGLLCAGAYTSGTWTDAAQCTFSNGTLTGFGVKGFPNAGCVKFEGTYGSSLSNVTMYQCVGSGFALESTNKNFRMSDLTVIDVWEDTAYVMCGYVYGQYNFGYIGGLTCGTSPGGYGTKNLTTADASTVRLATDTNNRITYGPISDYEVVNKTVGGGFAQLPTRDVGSSIATCQAGALSYDSDEFFVCTSANTWKKVGIAP